MPSGLVIVGVVFLGFWVDLGGGYFWCRLCSWVCCNGFWFIKIPDVNFSGAL